jgi:pimeloyl-ACP methyl ester carboxylesterase
MGLSVEEKWIDVDGYRTRYLVGGEGQPIVLVHGGYPGDDTGAESAEIWEENLAALTRRYRCIVPDRLGQGLTDLPASDRDYRMAASVEHFIAFLIALGCGSYHLAGHSSGAYIALQALLKNPELARSCTIVSSDTAAPRSGRGDFLLASNPHEPCSRDRARHHLESQCFDRRSVTKAWVDRVLGLFDSEKHRTAVDRMHAGGLYESYFLPELRSDREAMFRSLASRPLDRPILLYWGFDDPVAPVGLSYDLYDSLSRVEFRTRMHVVNQAGHYSFRERPEEFNQVFSDFIEDVQHGA